MKKDYFRSFDNNEFLYRVWNYKQGQRAMVVIHRGHEHSERLADFATDDRFSDYSIFAFDMRGHGYTKAQTSPVYMDSVRDLESFVKFIKKEFLVQEDDLFVVANSIAGVIVSTWLHDYAPKVRGAALLAPAFKIKLYIPFAKKGIELATKINSDFHVSSYVKSKVLTHDKKEQERYDADDLITKNINGRLLVDLSSGGKRIVKESHAIETPIILFSAGKDYVVDNLEQKKFYVNLGADLKEFVTLNNFFHGILFEKERYEVYDKLKVFIEKAYNKEKPLPSLEPKKFSIIEHDLLSLRIIHPIKNISYQLQKRMLRSFGGLSKGMRLGLKYGFDSGISLDYVYKNKPQGLFGIGKIIDKGYLEAPGWEGIRIRKKNFLTLIGEEVRALEKAGEEVRILDIAGGTGNYLFDLKREFPNIKVIVNEFKRENIEAGEKRIADEEVEDFCFTNYDCFDIETYKKLDFKPNIVIISGIFELFGENKLVINAIKGVTSILEKDSKVIYTGQPWHPQLEQIAYVLNSHQGVDWVMRRRSQRELDDLFEYCGVKKQQMLIDDKSIFTVTVGNYKGND